MIDLDIPAYLRILQEVRRESWRAGDAVNRVHAGCRDLKRDTPLHKCSALR